MGLIGIVLKVVGALVLVVVALGSFLWFTDYQVDATVKETGRDGDGHYVVLKPKVIPYDIKRTVDADAAAYVCEGYSVSYKIQTKYLEVRDREDRRVYDSEQGLTRAFPPVQCSLLGA